MTKPMTRLPGRRAVPEWIGATPDSKVPDHVRLRIFQRDGGRCHIAGRKIWPGEPWDLEHVIALRDWQDKGYEGHGNRESNLAPALKDKHREKTAREATERAEAEQVFAKHHGIKKRKGRGLTHPTLKRTMDGRVVERT
jgi:5-methylcytosine-specific restriction protein A